MLQTFFISNKCCSSELFIHQRNLGKKFYSAVFNIIIIIIIINLFSKLGWELGLYYASYDDFHPDILARMYT